MNRIQAMTGPGRPNFDKVTQDDVTAIMAARSVFSEVHQLSHVDVAKMRQTVELVAVLQTADEAADGAAKLDTMRRTIDALEAFQRDNAATFRRLCRMVNGKPIDEPEPGPT